MLLTIGSLIVVLGVLIFVHELGHFLVAKAVGIQVLRFSLGFGRPVVQFRRGETEYWISWIPLGGYVKMAGLEDEGMAGELEGGKSVIPVDPARAFDQQPLWARMAVILAGVSMNVLLAFVIYAGLGIFVGVPHLATTQVDTVLTEVLPPGAEALGTLKYGDRIVRIGGDTIVIWDAVLEHLVNDTGGIRIEVAGRPEPIVVRPPPPEDRNARLRIARAIEPLLPARVGLIFPGQPAQRAGMQPGDLVIRAGGDSIRSWSQMLRKIWYSPGKPLEVEVLRGDRVVKLTLVPKAQPDTESISVKPKIYGMIGAEPNPPMVTEPLPPGTAVTLAAKLTVRQVAVVVVSVKRLIFRESSVSELGGPILIAQVSGQVARLGIERFLNFLAFFSVSLAVLNLLPIPVLDGGHALFLIAEAVRRKPLSIQLRLRLTQIGMLVVLAIMALAIANDVLRFFPR